MNGIAAVFYRDYRQRITNIGFMFWDLFAPLAYLTLFGLGFERLMAGGVALEGRAVGYATFLLPGVLAMTAFSVAMNTSWTFFMDKDSGIFYEILTYPITRTQFLIGKICFNVLMAATGSALAVALGVIAMKVPIRWELLPLTLGAVMLTTAGWFFMFAAFSIRMSRMDAFNTFTSACYILLMFLSTMFYPIQDLPAWFRWVARINPMTWQVDMLRFSLLGVGDPMTVVIQTVAYAGFAGLGLAMAVRALNRVS
jgi:ABC-2 type transport system permease protein